MRLIISKLFLFMLITAYGLNVHAQTCTGSLGDPVINETFGAGATFSSVGDPLGLTVTNLKYTTSPCPDDGEYSLVPSTGGCFAGTWDVLGQDHTGDKNGYMMVINANDAPSVFYTQKADGSKLCPNTTYEFAAWILNILRDEPQTAGYVRPNLTFSIETASGTVLKTYNTGDIPATDLPIWKQYGTFFTTPSDGSDIVVKLSNNTTGSLGNDFVLDDITFKPCGPVIETGFGTIGNTTTQNQCAGGTSSYTLVASQQGYDNPTYQWQGNSGNGWSDIKGATASSVVQTFTNPPGGVYQYRVGILNGNNTSINCRIYSAPITINITSYPSIGLPAQTTVCQGLELRLQALGGDTYQWTGPNGFTSTDENPVITDNATTAINGIYSVSVTSNGCASFASTTVNVFPKVTVLVSNDATICEGASTNISAAQSTGGLYYKWTPSTGLDHDDQPTVTATPSQTTRYAVVVSNDGCYDDSKSVTVTVLKKPGANAGNNETLKEGESVQLKGTATGDSVSYYWTPADHLNNPNSLTPIASPVDNTTYTLHVISNNNCGESTSSIFVRVFKKLIIPNTFTPNNDGVNDYWDIKEINTYPDNLVTVYNRYGREVFQSTGYPKPWDGTYNNERLPVGTYYYIIDLKNNLPKVSGWVLIVR